MLGCPCPHRLLDSLRNSDLQSGTESASSEATSCSQFSRRFPRAFAARSKGRLVRRGKARSIQRIQIVHACLLLHASQ